MDLTRTVNRYSRDIYRDPVNLDTVDINGLYELINALIHPNIDELLNKVQDNIKLKRFLLRIAIRNSNINMCEFLLKDGMNLNFEFSDGTTPLEHAIMRHSNLDLIYWLLSHHADPNHQDFTGLVTSPGTTTLQWVLDFLSNNQRKVDIVKLLIEFGADPTIRDSRDKTAYNTLESKQNAMSEAMYEELFNLLDSSGSIKEPGEY